MSWPTVTIEPVAPPLVKPFQFTILTLILVTAAVAVFMALVTQAPPFISVGYVFFVLIGTAIWIQKYGIALGLGTLLVGGIALEPMIQSSGCTAGPRNTCNANIRQITLALLNYEAANRHLPPAYIADENGKPMHSWRVLILPYLGESALYNKYNFDEPWDGPNNSKLHDVIVSIYQCPKQTQIDSNANKVTLRGMTSYVAVVGPDTAWPGDKTIMIEDIANLDGSTFTIMAVEVANSGIHWMEPRDLHVTQMNPKINPKMGQGISSTHESGACVSFVDGHATFLFEDDLDPEMLKALLTVDGGEDVSEFFGE